MPAVNIVPKASAIRYALDGSNQAEVLSFLVTWTAWANINMYPGLLLNPTVDGAGTIAAICDPSWVGVALTIHKGDWAVWAVGGVVSQDDDIFNNQWNVLP